MIIIYWLRLRAFQGRGEVCWRCPAGGALEAMMVQIQDSLSVDDDERSHTFVYVFRFVLLPVLR